MEEWTSDSNESLVISMVRSPVDKDVLTETEDYEEFNPTFTYPIFGDKERIYGYRDLVIDFKFASGSLAQFLAVSYSEKLNSSTVDDIEGTLYKFIPPDYLKNEEDFEKRVEHDATHFKPLGEKIYSYKRRLALGKGKGKADVASEELNEDDEDVVTYEVYHANWDTPGFRAYHRRMQIFILLYIEAGSYIQEDDEGWEFAVLYEKRKRPDKTITYHFAGYSTLFPFYCFPERVRMRLSQFVILPPYQRSGHGSELYKAIYNYILKQPRIAELTVEDPAEAFEDLRDKNDLQMLLNNADFMLQGLGSSSTVSAGLGKGKMGPPADKIWVEKWRRDLKMAGRQFHRLVEMLILKYMTPEDVRAMRAYRLQVKERIYKFNFDSLAQLDREERLEKLEETFQSVKDGYQEILSRV
ncbi:histone acetyltransferase type B catalytic subunit [Schizopora paradoxa]|uniref:Histone acetyltransferase type B catalytic subunit n=1 Tax=Schizopora paradoxa TaxID=27342 RepID=A0A0H2SD34_9AGAM|nr:histone acetyltransferase type B catalytic subunit [Schizopora paradoxa]